MTIDEAITVLELHNAWRKGADIEMHSTGGWKRLQRWN
jgi:hypothetical protein